MSGPALFMNLTIIGMALVAGASLALYYTGTLQASWLLWTGITAFMVLYHFGLRIMMGNVTKGWHIHWTQPFFRERAFEAGLYRRLRVRAWKGKVLTYDPGAFDLSRRSLDEIATTMAKSETDHWVNEAISLLSLLFGFVWGEWWIFILTALFAMAFDAQFIVIQRYNRPRVLRVMEKRKRTN